VLFRWRRHERGYSYGDQAIMTDPESSRSLCHERDRGTALAGVLSVFAAEIRPEL
jgi:hypothetical protein